MANVPLRSFRDPMLKIILVQMNTIVGDVDGNLRRSLEALGEAKKRGADLLILPEQTLLGYPAKDMLTLRQVITHNEKAVRKFAEATADGPAAIIGFAEHQGQTGKGLYNSAAFCRAGKIETVYRKRLLPTYDVFDEDRYFNEGRETCVLQIKGIAVGVTICEDLWSNSLYWSHRLYTIDPVAETVKAGAKLIVNISASPFTMEKGKVRRELLANMARQNGVPIATVNLVGGNDDLVFDGRSMVVDGEGKIVASAKALREDLLDFCLDNGQIEGRIEEEPGEIEALFRALVLGIRDYVRKCGFKSVCLGLSGGIDSALVAALAAEALGAENVHGVSMPSRYSSDHSVSDAEALAASLGIQYSSIPIEGMFASCLEELSPHLKGQWTGIAEENIQARLRGLTLMSLANAAGSLVLAAGNKTEIAVGYCTLYGDMAGGLAPIGDVPKLLVYTLSRYINDRAGHEVIPENTITKPPSAELRPDQKDTDSLPPYEVLDPIVRGYVEWSKDEEALVGEGFDRETVRKVLRLIDRSEYKRRQAAPALKITSRAFGFGWRMPIARK